MLLICAFLESGQFRGGMPTEQGVWVATKFYELIKTIRSVETMLEDWCKVSFALSIKKCQTQL